MALIRMYQRRGTLEQWNTGVIPTTVILQPGEIGIETDTGRFKIGNGTNVWSELPYYLPDNNPTNAAIRQGKNSHDVYAKLSPLAPQYAQTFTGIQTLVPQSNAQTPLVVSGLAGQSAVLQRWRSNTDVTLASIDQTGKLTAEGGASFNNVVNVNSHKVTNVAAPTADADAANKLYVDQAIAGLAWKTPVNLVSLETGTDLEAWIDVPLTGNTGTVELDGHAALTQAHGNNYRLLLLNQTTPENDGIWVYSDNGTTYTLTRALDSDTFAELKGASVFVQEGDLYGTSSFVQTNHYLSSWSGQDWVQFNGASQITAGNGLVKEGNVIDVVGTADRITANADSIDIASTYVGQTSIVTLGTVTAGTWEASVIGATKGGTGQSSYSVGDILYADTTTTLAKLIPGTSGHPLVSGGTGSAPSYAQVNTVGIADNAVTYEKMQNVSGPYHVLGRLSSGEGNVEELNSDNLMTVINQGNTDIAFNILPVGTTSTTVAQGDHTHTLDNLSDVVISGTPALRQVLKYDGEKWINELPSGGISIGATPPVDASSGDAWFDSTDGSLYVYYDDGNGNVAAKTTLAEVSIDSSVTSGYKTRLVYSATYNSGANTHSVSYAYYMITSGGSYITNLPISGYLNIDGNTVWGASGNYNFPANSTTLITSGIYTRPFVANSLNTVTLNSMVDDGGGIPYPPQILLSSSSDLATGSPSASAQWVQVKANSALEASILTRLSAVESRNTKIEAANAVRVADATERDSVYPAPVQGNTVFRADLGYEEKYYAAYNATTNPDGTTGTAGWYRYAGGAPLSQNYMINGALDIWQRGTSFAPVSNTAFTADRWQAQASLVSTSRTIQQFALAQAITGIEDIPYYLRSTVNTIGTGTNTRLRYKVEDVKTLAGKTVTFSWYGKQNIGANLRVLIQQNFGTGGSTSVTAYDANSTYTTSWNRFSATFTLPSVSGKTISADSFIQIELFQSDSTGSALDVTGFQLEEGPVATPFRRNQENIQAELAACQRYYQRISSTGQNYTHYAMGNASAATGGTVIFKHEVPMRTKVASFEYSQIAVVRYGLTHTAITSIAWDLNISSENYTGFNIGFGSYSVSAGDSISMIANGTTSSYFAISAEL